MANTARYWRIWHMSRGTTLGEQGQTSTSNLTLGELYFYDTAGATTPLSGTYDITGWNNPVGNLTDSNLTTVNWNTDSGFGIGISFDAGSTTTIGKVRISSPNTAFFSETPTRWVLEYSPDNINFYDAGVLVVESTAWTQGETRDYTVTPSWTEQFQVTTERVYVVSTSQATEGLEAGAFRTYAVTGPSPTEFLDAGPSRVYVVSNHPTPGGLSQADVDFRPEYIEGNNKYVKFEEGGLGKFFRFWPNQAGNHYVIALKPDLVTFYEGTQYMDAGRWNPIWLPHFNQVFVGYPEPTTGEITGIKNGMLARATGTAVTGLVDPAEFPVYANYENNIAVYDFDLNSYSGTGSTVNAILSKKTGTLNGSNIQYFEGGSLSGVPSYFSLGGTSYVAGNEAILNGPSQPLTVAMAFKMNDTQDNSYLFDGDNGGFDWSIYTQTGLISLFTGTNEVISSFYYNDFQWHVIVAEWSDDGVKLWGDGTLHLDDPTISYDSTVQNSFSFGNASMDIGFFGAWHTKLSTADRQALEADLTARYVSRGTPVTPSAYGLQNLDAETGDLTGWTNTNVLTRNYIDGQANELFGSYYFGGGDFPTSTAYQDMDLSGEAESIDAGNRTIEVTWKQSSFGGADQARIALLLYDNSGLVASSEPTMLSTVNRHWHERSTGVLNIPVGTRTARIRMDFNRILGTQCNGYIDDIKVYLNSV